MSNQLKYDDTIVSRYMMIAKYRADSTRDTEYICKRKPLNEDMTECNLRQQSQETQDAIYNILCKE